MAKKDKGVLAGDPVTYQIPDPAGGVKLETFIPWTLVKRGVKREVIMPLDKPEAFLVEAAGDRRARKIAQDTPLMRALGLAHYWQKLLENGQYRSIREIAAAEGMDRGQASRIAQLVHITPNIIEIYVAGKNDKLTLEFLIRRSFPKDWKQQQDELFAMRMHSTEPDTK